MNFKQLSAGMTEQALCILMAIAPSADGEKVVDIADSLGMGDPEVEFILQQFVEFNIATKNGWGRYALTPEYRAYKRGTNLGLQMDWDHGPNLTLDKK